MIEENEAALESISNDIIKLGTAFTAIRKKPPENGYLRLCTFALEKYQPTESLQSADINDIEGVTLVNEGDQR